MQIYIYSQSPFRKFNSGLEFKLLIVAQSLNSKPLFKKNPNYLMVESLNSKPLFKKIPNYLVVESLSYHQHDSKAAPGFFSVLVVRVFA